MTASVKNPKAVPQANTSLQQLRDYPDPLVAPITSWLYYL